jgi:hypothetical protein
METRQASIVFRDAFVKQRRQGGSFLPPIKTGRPKPRQVNGRAGVEVAEAGRGIEDAHDRQQPSIPADHPTKIRPIDETKTGRLS